MNLSSQRHLKKCGVLLGISSAVGLIYYEHMKLQKRLNKVIEINVLDIDKKRPDYIYIKYQLYRESKARLKTKEQDKNWRNIIIHPFGKWWKSIKHSVAWRLLEVAKRGDHHDRLKAVAQLARIDHLKDWDYQHLAQICDYRTAISLARTNCDTRWFLPPKAHSAYRAPPSIICELRELFDDLTPCTCLSNFYNKVLNPYGSESYYEKSCTTDIEITKTDMELMKKCIQIMGHLIRRPDYAAHIIERGGLSTLMEMQKLTRDNLEVRFLLAKLIANIAAYKEYANDFFVTGWIGVLANWTKDPDMRVQVIAAKALSNLDEDDHSHFVYHTSIFPLYPLAKRNWKPDLDVIFIHGLLGGVFVTWRQKDRGEDDELGLYGKPNAIISSETDEVFLVDKAAWKPLLKSSKGYKITPLTFIRKPIRGIYDREETMTCVEHPLLSKNIFDRKTRRKSKKILKPKESTAQELINSFTFIGELESDWEIVFPDCPLAASESAKGQFSVAGDEWINVDRKEEYTYCWPMEWLPEDYPNIRIMGLNYETSLSEWASSGMKCPCEKHKSTLRQRTMSFIEELVEAGVGQDRPILFIGHSMGGLLIKSILTEARHSKVKPAENIYNNTRGIIFLGTPHKGSSIAKMRQHMHMILSPSVEVKELEENGPMLLELHEKFLTSINDLAKNIEVISIAEGKPTFITALKFPFRIVTEESARLPFGDFYTLNVDHLNLSKPAYRQSFLYQRILTVIDDILVREQEIQSKQSAEQKHTDDENELRILANLDEQVPTKYDSSTS